MSFGWHGLLGIHSSRGRLRICKKTYTKQEQKTKGRIKNGLREKMAPQVFISVGIRVASSR